VLAKRVLVPELVLLEQVLVLAPLEQPPVVLASLVHP